MWNWTGRESEVDIFKRPLIYILENSRELWSKHMHDNKTTAIADKNCELSCF